MHLAGFGERLIFRVLASPKLSVRTKTIKSIEGKTPKPNWLLLWAASALPDETEIHMFILTAPLQKSTCQAIYEILVVSKKKKTHSSGKLNLSTWGHNSKPREAQVFSDSFHTYISLSVRTKPSGKRECTQGCMLLLAGNFRFFLRRNIWPCVPAKQGLQKPADLI